MAYAGPFIYIKALGHFGSEGGPIERWNSGLKINSPGTPPLTSTLPAFLAALSTPYSVFHAGISQNAGTTCFLTGLSAAVIGTDGKYLGGGTQATTVYTYGSPVAGVGTGVMPWSTAMCISLRTQQLRGLASNGRMYWPTLALTPAPGTGVWTSSQTQNSANQAKVLLDAINAQANTFYGSDHKISVMSNKGSGVTATVTGVRVGGKPDRQERRERSLLEAYTSASVAAADELERANGQLQVGEPRFLIHV